MVIFNMGHMKKVVNVWWFSPNLFKRLVIGGMCGVLLSACMGDLPPTPTPSAVPPPLEPSPTFDISPQYMTPPSAFEESRPGMTVLDAARVPADSEFVPEVIDQLPPEDRPRLLNITLPDNAQLPAELYVGVPGGKGVVLIGEPLEDWGGFAATLHQLGHSVLEVQARLPAQDGDVSAMLTALITITDVQTDLVVIGAGRGADVALLGCAEDARCGTAILLSPRQSGELVAVMSDYNPRPLLLVASLDDSPGIQTAEALRIAARGDVLLQPFESAGIGTQMLTQRADLRGLITTWIDRFGG